MKEELFLGLDSFMLFFKVTNMNTARIICSCDIHKKIRRGSAKKQWTAVFLISVKAGFTNINHIKAKLCLSK